MYLRMTGVQAAHYSGLLSIPFIADASIVEARQFTLQVHAVGLALIIAGTIVAAFTGYIAIRILFWIINKRAFSFFAAYCFAIGMPAILFI